LKKKQTCPPIAILCWRGSTGAGGSLGPPRVLGTERSPPTATVLAELESAVQAKKFVVLSRQVFALTALSEATEVLITIILILFILQNLAG